MKINVESLAKLARLDINDDLCERYHAQMTEMLGLISLPSVEGDGPLIDRENIMELRPDEITSQYKRSDLFANAPQVQAGCIVVPKIANSEE